MDYQNSFKIILHAGNAKSLVLQSIQSAEENDFEQAKKLIEEANQEMLAAHEQHKSLLVQLANGERVDVDLMMVHAEDHLNSANEEILLAQHLIKIYKRLEEK